MEALASPLSLEILASVFWIKSIVATSNNLFFFKNSKSCTTFYFQKQRTVGIFHVLKSNFCQILPKAVYIFG